MRSASIGDAGPRSRSICPLTGRTGTSRAPAGRRSCPLQAPPASTTLSAATDPADVATALTAPPDSSIATTSTPPMTSPPSRSTASRSARTTARGSTWESRGASTPPRTRGERPDSSRRQSRPDSHSASRPSDRWSSCSRRSSSASSRSTAATKAPLSRYARSIPVRSASSAANDGHAAALSRFSPRSASSPNSASVTGASIPAATPDAPAPGSPRSTTSTDRPDCAMRQAQDNPMIPPPTTTVSYPRARGDSLTHVPSAVSRADRCLRRHYPDQVRRSAATQPPSQPGLPELPFTRPSLARPASSGCAEGEAARRSSRRGGRARGRSRRMCR